MKKITYLFLATFFVATSTIANPVTKQTAQAVAVNFYSQRFQTTPLATTLSYIEFANDGQPVYYIFNVKNNAGFVIVSAEDAAHPILGYSNKGQYSNNSNVDWWMNCRKQEIVLARIKNIAATAY